MQSINELKKQLLLSPKLSDLLSGFMDIMEQKDSMRHQKTVDFTSLGQDHELVHVIKCITAMTSRFLSKPIQISLPMLCELASESFYHGFCMSEDLPMPLTLFYFSDIQTGLFALSGLNASTEIFKFSLAKSEPLNAVH